MSGRNGAIAPTSWETTRSSRASPRAKPRIIRSSCRSTSFRRNGRFRSTTSCCSTAASNFLDPRGPRSPSRVCGPARCPSRKTRQGNGGLRFDYIKDDVPAQHLPPTRFRLNAVDTPALDCSPCQSDFSPRVSVAYDLFGTGKTALKFAVGRYMLARGNSGVYNPANFVVTNASRQWNDANGNFVPDCDLTMITANGECAALNNNRF